MSLTDKQIAEIAVNAALAAVKLATGGAPDQAAVAVDEESEQAKIDRQRQADLDAAEAGRVAAIEREQLDNEIDDVATRLVDLVLQPRHREAFDFKAASEGLTAGRLLVQALRQLSASWRQDMLEARGQGGGTTRKAQPTG